MENTQLLIVRHSKTLIAAFLVAFFIMAFGCSCFGGIKGTARTLPAQAVSQEKEEFAGASLLPGMETGGAVMTC